MKYAILAGAVALAFATTAGAKEIPSGGVTYQDVMTWLQGAGYQAKLEGTGDGQNIMSSADGGPFHIYLYDCKAGR